MNIIPPLQTLEGLKCGECECYLSRAPIYLKQNGVSICGRCFTPPPLTAEENDEEKSEKLYHEVAFEKLLRAYKFPCMYKGEGCGEQVPFSDMEQHEKTCKFRPIKCLISLSGSCDWFEMEDKLYDHCVENHPSQVLQRHPFVFEHDVTKSSLQSYIAKLCEILFLIHVKVCLKTHKIYHSVQCVSGDLTSNKLKFTLTIKRGDEKLTKKGDVLPYSQTTIHKDTSVACGINSLMEVLGGFTNTVFIIDLALNSNCIKCKSIKSVLSESEFCINCKKKCYQLCRNASKGCKFSHIASNVLTVHELSLCLYNIKKQCLQCYDFVENSSIDWLVTHIKTHHESNWILENEYYSDFFSFYYSECNSWISYVINSRYGKLIFICDTENLNIRILSLDNNDGGEVDFLSGLKCTMFFKNKRNEQEIIEKTFSNYEDVIEITKTLWLDYFHKVSFSKE